MPKEEKWIGNGIETALTVDIKWDNEMQQIKLKYLKTKKKTLEKKMYLLVTSKNPSQYLGRN